MTTPKDGGSAFPLPAFFSPQTGPLPGEEGMTLRDWFAGLAMQGDWAAQGPSTVIFSSSLSKEAWAKQAALYYRMADAMIAERER